MKEKNSILEQVKATRKQSREEEIKAHGKPINYRKIKESKKSYNRKRNKADDEVLPYFFWGIYKEKVGEDNSVTSFKSNSYKLQVTNLIKTKIPVNFESIQTKKCDFQTN